jgi:Ni/Fe-hydrogenase 1 B-type cytochrome subunit
VTAVHESVPLAAPAQALEPTAILAEPARRDSHLRVYVWQIPVRITHWVTAGAIVVLTVTGLYIADPFLIPPGGSVMGTIRFLHMAAGIVLLASGLLRTAWLLTGNRWARWSAFFPTNRRQLAELWGQASFYAFIRRHAPRVIGHNQLAASAYIVLWALLLLLTVTGFALDGLLGSEPGATLFGWLRDLLGAQTIRLVHHLAMWGVLAISLFHIYSSVLVDHHERNGLVSSIVTGYKFFTRDEIDEARDGGPDVEEARE